MKAAILGTNDYHATMQQVAKHALQRQAGYIAPVAKGAVNLQLPSILECFAVHADTIVRTLLKNSSLFDCNPRSPYVYFAWILGGADSPYRFGQSNDDVHYHCCIALALINLALGQSPHILMSRGYTRLRRRSTNDREIAENIANIAATAALVRDSSSGFRIRLASLLTLNDLIDRLVDRIKENPEKFPEEFGDTKRSDDELQVLVAVYLTHRMREWIYLSDSELLPVIRRILLDVLEVKV